MVIRLKVLKRANKEQQLDKVKDLMQMFHVDRNTNYQFQPIGASSFSNSQTAINDPRIQKSKALFQMFHLAR